MIINLIRESDSALHAEAQGVPSHRVAAFPFEDAEREVRRRVLRSLADRANPPTAVVFVRTWELVTLGVNQGDPCNLDDRSSHPTSERVTVDDPVRVPVDPEQLANPPRKARGRKGQP